MTPAAFTPISLAALRRDVLRLTQREASALVGVSSRTLARWEAGKASRTALRAMAMLARERGVLATCNGAQVLTQIATAPDPAGAGAQDQTPEPPPPETSGCPI